MYKYLSSSRSYLRQGTLRYLHAASSSKSSILTEAACWRFHLCWRRVRVCSFSVLLWCGFGVLWFAVKWRSWSVRSEVFLFRVELSCLITYSVIGKFAILAPPSTATTSSFDPSSQPQQLWMFIACLIFRRGKTRRQHHSPKPISERCLLTRNKSWWTNCLAWVIHNRAYKVGILFCFAISHLKNLIHSAFSLDHVPPKAREH